MKYTSIVAIASMGLLLGSCASERTTFVRGNTIEWQAKNVVVPQSAPLIVTPEAITPEETASTATDVATPVELASVELTASVGSTTLTEVEARPAKRYVANAVVTSETPIEVAAMATEVLEANAATAVETPVAPSGGGGKSQTLAAVLAFFLGGIGIHRFYLGYTWQGIVQILTLGGLGIWALIDFIRICIGDLEPKDGSYN